MSSRGRFGPLVGAIDEGTSSARFLVFAAKTAEVLTYHQEHIEQICPKEGWVEQDPMEILQKVEKCLETSVDHLNKLDIDPGDIVSIGLTNQRETTIVWDPLTGKPLYNAIVWLDVRNADIVENLKAKVQGKKAETLKSLSGLPISTYFSALKLRWLLDNVPEVKVAVDEGRCLFGTVDTWLTWNLTGGVEGGLHITDVTNASRTMLMNLQTLQWDSTLCRFFGIPMSVLPTIKSSSEIYGYLAEGSLRGVPISGCLGDQQAALVGQMCLKQGQAKNTYGTGCFLLYNTGTAIVQSSHGLLTTVAYQLGRSAAAVYALEGSVAVAGAAVSWLRDNLQVLPDVKLTADLARAASSAGQVVFVPAFSGLYAPYWRNDARGLICGFSEETKKEQLVKAALEAVCFQTRDILEAMHQDCGIPLTRLLVDGGMTINSYAMQLQADLCGIPVVHPWMFEATALGAAMAAGSAEGIQVWDLHNMQPVPSDTYLPTISEDERDLRYAKWKMGIQRSTGWDLEASHNPNNNHKPNADTKVFSMLPCGMFVMSTFALLLVSQYFNADFKL